MKQFLNGLKSIVSSIHAATVSYAFIFLFVLLDGVKQEKIDMLQAILAQFKHQYQVRLWDSKGVPFRTYMYVSMRVLV